MCKPSSKLNLHSSVINSQISSLSTLSRTIVGICSQEAESQIFECEHTEADAIMFCIYSHIRSTDIHILVVIDSEDTDVVVLASYVAHNVDGVLAMKRRQNIIDCRSLCPHDIAAILLALHVHSGSDYISFFRSRQKERVCKGNVYRRCSNPVGLCWEETSYHTRGPG